VSGGQYPARENQRTEQLLFFELRGMADASLRANQIKFQEAAVKFSETNEKFTVSRERFSVTSETLAPRQMHAPLPL
jgi:hypothetical protein